jgi:DNA polymerase-3 subunit gamma/tau
MVDMDDIQKLNLTRRYRPKSMSEYIGNERLKETVLGWLGTGHRPQTILLRGSTGGGKTTMARLIAKEYLCENRSIETGACGECASCQAVDRYIATGNTDDLVNIVEINASKDNGIAAINAVLEEAYYPSFDGSWKIYILDECHRISIAAQNSLLKLVEEPPENVLFMFCTTDPEKMLDTLLNRCNIKMDVKKPTEEQMAKLLYTICAKEGVPCDRRGLSLIVDRSELVIRQALMDLENVIVQQGDVTYESVIKVFDEKPNSLYFDFFECLLNKDTFRYVSVLHKIKSTMTLKEFVRNLTNFTKRGIYIFNGVDLEGITTNEIHNMKNLFKRFSLTEQGLLLDFLTKVNDGDVETNLLLLGFKGLSSKMLDDEGADSVIMESNSDVAKENIVTAEGKKEISRQRQNRSNESVKSAIENISIEEALDIFN